MSTAIHIAVDAMSGDFGPRTTIPAAVQVVRACPDLALALVGDCQLISQQLSALGAVDHPRINLHQASDIVAMDADPRAALRHQRDSSMWQALSLVQSGDCDACVSAGNTGALMAISRYLLKTFPGIDRPAICKSMPVSQGKSYMLDLGANLSCTSEQLHQFALLGSVLASAGGVQRPRVALLNIGTESGKGTKTVQSAGALIAADTRLNYAGYLEANGIYRGEVDVIVCDGFSGNIALKASEGVAQLIAHKISASFNKRWYYRLLSLSLRALLRSLQRELNPGSYNGACFLGLQKVVVKSHGSADVTAFAQALMVAREQVLQKVPERTGQQLCAGGDADTCVEVGR